MKKPVSCTILLQTRVCQIVSPLITALLSFFVPEFLALPQQHDETKTGCFLERGGGREGGGGGRGGGLQGLCSVSRNLLTPLASAESLRGGGGEEERRQEEDEEEHSEGKQKAPAKLGAKGWGGGCQQADTWGGFYSKMSSHSLLGGLFVLYVL